MNEVKRLPKLRFPEFSNSYKFHVFDDIVSITRLAGYEYSQYWKEDSNEEIIALRGYNIGVGKLELRDLSYISNQLSLKLIRSRLSKGDIVYPCVGSIGNAVVIEEDNKYHIQQNIAKITCRENIDEYFISQFLMSHLGMREVLRFNATSSQPNVLVGSLRQFKVNLPKYPEQQKIASFLTLVDKKITQLQQKKTLLEQYKKGVMQQIFSQELRFKADDGSDYPDWEEKKFKNLVTINQGLQISISKRLTRSEEGAYFYITNEFLKKDSKKKYYIKNPPKSVLCKKEDVLMTRTGNTGKVVTNVEGAFHNNFFKIDYPKSINKMFLYNFLNLSKTQNTISKLAGTSTIPDLNHSDFYNIKVGYPKNIGEQTKIANFLLAIDDKIQLVDNQLENTQQFKKGLFQQMFV